MVNAHCQDIDMELSRPYRHTPKWEEGTKLDY